MDARIAVREADGTFVRSDAGARPIYSITKTVIAATVVTMGIDLDRPVADWFGPEWVPRGADISLRRLLNHTSGLRDYSELPEYKQAVNACEPPWSDDTFAEHTLRRPLRFEPGAGWAYSNAGYWVLTQVLQREADAPLAEVFQGCVLDPLGLVDTHLAAGPLESDLPRYDAGWVWHSTLVGTARDVATFMASDLVRPLRADPVDVGLSEPPLWRKPRYALGLMTEPDHRYGHMGSGPGMTNACFVFLETGRTVCALATQTTSATLMPHVLELGTA